MKSLITSYSVIRTASLGVALAMCAAQAQSQDYARIGFVNNERIMREAIPARQAQAKMEQEFSLRSKELQQLDQRLKAASERYDRDSPSLSEAERNRRQRELVEMDRELQRKQREFREDAAQRLNEERTLFLSKADKVIKQIAEAEKYDIIFQEGVYVNPRIDITDKVLRILNR